MSAITVTTRVCPLRAREDSLHCLDQRQLPRAEVWLTLRTAEEVAAAIATLTVRGAPLIGAAALYGLWLGALRAVESGVGPELLPQRLSHADAVLRHSRPTAVNLFHALDAGLAAAGPHLTDGARLVEALRAAADGWAQADARACERLSLLGGRLLPDQGTVLTHCNAGALATCGVGTALGVIRAAHAMGKRLSVLADETRPLLQGARLTAWELMQDGLPVTLCADGASAHLMWRGAVHAVVVGADRVALNGDVANKVGTYPVALAARAHGIPFYVAAPASTLDRRTPTGRDIPIEERAAEEVTSLAGVPVAAPGVAVANPAFDVTDAHLITALITERGVAQPVNQATVSALLGMEGG